MFSRGFAGAGQGEYTPLKRPGLEVGRFDFSMRAGHAAGMGLIREWDLGMNETYSPFHMRGTGLRGVVAGTKDWMKSNYGAYNKFQVATKGTTRDVAGRIGNVTRIGGLKDIAGKITPSSVGKFAFRRLAGPAFLAYSAYSGYKEEGIWGATKGVAGHLAFTYALGHLGKAALPLAAVAAGVLAGYETGKMINDPSSYFTLRRLVRDNTSKFLKQHKGLEMGTPTVDNFGTAATMRQRSLNAIMDSRINGRNALGNEAGLLYRPYFR